MRISSYLGKRACFAVALGFVLSDASAAFAEERTVVGQVFYRGGEPAAGAAVQLEDLTTLRVVSRRTDRDGHYRFLGLNPDTEYELRATKNGYWSKAHTVSKFSSRKLEKVDLYLTQEPH